MFKKITLALCASIIVGISYCTLVFLAKPIFHGKQEPIITHIKPHILLTCLVANMGGGEEHFIKLASMLKTNEYPISILTEHDSCLSKYFTTHNIPHYTSRAPLLAKRLRFLYHFVMKQCMETIYQERPYNFITCNNIHELRAAKAIAEKHSARVIFTRHISDQLNREHIRGIYAAIGVSQQIAEYLEHENKTKNLGIQHICSIPPLYNQERCLNYFPSLSRKEFFKNALNISITNAPIITMIAAFTSDLNKNHKLLIEAIDTLINKEHYVLQVMLAGDGPSRKMIERMVHERNLTPYVHFLGYFKDIPGLLYHSDIMTLTSKKEALGIVYLEAGLMKKPSIGTRGTGAEAVIIHEQTGLLFKNNDCADLVACIKQLLDNPKFARQLGKNAHKHVLDNFSPETTFKKYEALYKMDPGS